MRSNRRQVSWLAGLCPSPPSRVSPVALWYGLAAYSCGGSRGIGNRIEAEFRTAFPVGALPRDHRSRPLNGRGAGFVNVIIGAHLERGLMAPVPPTSPYPAGALPLTLVLGGARSGKSRYAEGMITALPPPWIYVATAQAHDAEMAERIAAHRARRGAGWHTIEEPHDIASVLAANRGTVLIDCLTLWLSNRMLAGADIDAEIDALEVVSRRRVSARRCWCPTRSASASCPTTHWRGAFATCKVGSTSGSRRAPTGLFSWSPGCRLR